MTWEQVVKQLFETGWREDIKLCKACMPHPSSVPQMEKHYGSAVGQSADYRLLLSGGAGLHIREFDDHWTAHLDELDPRHDLFGHLLHDSPSHHALVMGVIGGVVSKLFGASDEDVWKWGLIFGGVSVVRAHAARRDDAMRLARLRGAS